MLLYVETVEKRLDCEVRECNEDSKKGSRQRVERFHLILKKSEFEIPINYHY